MEHLDGVTDVHGAKSHCWGWINIWWCDLDACVHYLMKAVLSAAQVLGCLNGGEKPSGDIRLLTIWLSWALCREERHPVRPVSMHIHSAWNTADHRPTCLSMLCRRRVGLQGSLSASRTVQDNPAISLSRVRWIWVSVSGCESASTTSPCRGWINLQYLNTFNFQGIRKVSVIMQYVKKIVWITMKI